MAAKVKALQQWCKLQCQGYRDVDVTNMTSSWKSGLAFCAIIHKYRPDLIDYDSLSKEDVFENNKLAFTVAKQLGIPALLDPEDMVIMTVPDKLCIVTYVSQYYNFFKSCHSVAPVKRLISEDIASTVPAKKPVLQASVGQNSAQDVAVGGAITSNNVLGSMKRHTMEDTCNACKDKVFLMERQLEGNKLYHRHCLRKLQKEQSSTLQLYCDAAVEDESKHRQLDPCQEIENYDNCYATKKKQSAEEYLELNKKCLPSASPQNSSSVAKSVSCISESTGETISEISETKDIVKSREVEPKSSTPLLNDQHASLANTNEPNLSSSIAAIGAADSSNLQDVLTEFTPSTAENRKVELTGNANSLCSSLTSEVHGDDSCAKMTLSSEQSGIIVDSFAHPVQSVAVCSIENSVNNIAPVSPGKNTSTSQHGSHSAVVGTRTLVNSSSEMSCQSNAPTPLRPSVPPVTVLHSPFDSCAIPPKPLRSAIHLEAPHDVITDPSNLTSAQSNSPGRSHLVHGSALSTTHSSGSIITDVHNTSATDNMRFSNLNWTDAKVTVPSSENATRQSVDIELNLRCHGPSDALISGQSMKSVSSHPDPVSRPIYSPGTPLHLSEARTSSSAILILPESKGMPISCGPSKTSCSLDAAFDSAKVELIENSVICPSSPSGSYDKTSAFSMKISPETLPSETSGKKLRSVYGRKSDETVAHSSCPQKAISKRPTSVMIKDGDNIESERCLGISNKISELSHQNLSGIQHPLVPPRPEYKGKAASVRNQEPVSKTNDGISFDNKPPHIPKRPPSILKHKEADVDNSVPNSLPDDFNKHNLDFLIRSQQSLNCKENKDPDSVLEVGNKLERIQSIRENPFNKVEQAEKSEEFSRSVSVEKIEKHQADSKSLCGDSQSQDKNACVNVESELISKPTPVPRSILKPKREAPLPPVQSSGSTWYVGLETLQLNTGAKEGKECVQCEKSVAPIPLPRNKSKKDTDPVPPLGQSLPASMSQSSSLSPKLGEINKSSISSEGMSNIKIPPPRPTPPTAENMHRARKKITPDSKFTFETPSFNFGPTSRNKKCSDGQELHMRSGAALVSNNKQPIVKRKVNAEDRLSLEHIAAQLKLLDDKLKELEKEGRLLEGKIRSGSDESMEDDDKNDLMANWFEMVNRKNDFVRQESDLIYRCKQQELEDKHEEVEFELRCLMNKPDNLKTASEKKREEMLLQKLLQTVSQRNSIVESIEEDRIRYLKEDEEIAQMLASSHMF